MARVPGAVDVHVQQITSAPRITIDTNRVVAREFGLTERDIADSLSISLSGSATGTENFWLNYKNGVSYQIVVQTPQYRVSSMDQLRRTPIAAAGQKTVQILDNVAGIGRTTTPLSLSHYDVQPVFDVPANVQGTDLGSVSDQVNRIIAGYAAKISKAGSI